MKAVIKCVSVPWKKLLSKLAVIRSHPAVFNQKFICLCRKHQQCIFNKSIFLTHKQAHTYTAPTPSQNVDFYFDLHCKSVKLGQL